MGTCRWFAKDKEDGLIERELVSGNAGFKGPTTNWKLTIVTGSDFGAGTDSDVVVEVHGGCASRHDRRVRFRARLVRAANSCVQHECSLASRIHPLLNSTTCSPIHR